MMMRALIVLVQIRFLRRLYRSQVCAIPPCPIRPVPIGRRGNRQHVVGAPTALEDFQATMANVGSMRVRWSVMRTTDSKVAVIADEYPDTLTRCAATHRSALLTAGLAFAQQRFRLKDGDAFVVWGESLTR